MITPSLEKIQPGFGSSFSVKEFIREPEGKRSHWHFHPEYEIVYISDGKGKRHIGNNISQYKGGDLIFIGPNLPHYGFDQNMDKSHLEIVIQMKPEFLNGPFFGVAEFESIRDLFERAKSGLVFSSKTKWELGGTLEALPSMNPFDRLITLVQIMQTLATAEDTQSLHAKGITLELLSQDHQRMEAVYQYVFKNFKRLITLEEIAELVHMTVPSFCRYFKKITHVTFTRFVNEFRIGHACRLLRREELSIMAVCLESGFNNVSHFNKKFKEITGESPSQYRKSHVWIVGDEDLAVVPFLEEEEK